MWSLRRPAVLVAMSQSTITAFFSRSTPRALSQVPHAHTNIGHIEFMSILNNYQFHVTHKKTPKRSRSESSDSDSSNKKGSPREVSTSPTSPIKVSIWQRTFVHYDQAEQSVRLAVAGNIADGYYAAFILESQSQILN